MVSLRLDFSSIHVVWEHKAPGESAEAALNPTAERLEWLLLDRDFLGLRLGLELTLGDCKRQLAMHHFGSDPPDIHHLLRQLEAARKLAKHPFIPACHIPPLLLAMCLYYH